MQERKREVILGSSSMVRRALSKRLGFPIKYASPDFQENHDEALAPVDMARLYSMGKAKSLSSSFAHALIIGADQTAEDDLGLLTKPSSLSQVKEQLVRLSGKEHQLHSGLALWDDSLGTCLTEVVTVNLRMRPLTEEMIDNYLSKDNPVGCVGGYVFEEHGYLLFEEVCGAEEGAISGLPMVTLASLLRKQGLDSLLL
ncbi:MAG: Maf family protein [Myxococcota bacterium]|nr:Maf family protein [Myxococcota bacterium]